MQNYMQVTLSQTLILTLTVGIITLYKVHQRFF